MNRPWRSRHSIKQIAAAVLASMLFAPLVHSQQVLSDGEIRKVALEQVKAGDKVKFQAEKVGGAFTVTKIEPAK